MQVWLRVLIVWFIAFALPVQGMAAVTMAHCGPSHERTQKAQAETGHPHSAHAAGLPHPHGEAASAASAGLDGASAKINAQADPIELAKYKCSSCAACCAGSALPSVMPRIPVIPSSPAVFTETVVSVDALASGGPDRPPRTSRV